MEIPESKKLVNAIYWKSMSSTGTAMVQYLSSVLVYSSNNASFTITTNLARNINEGVFFGQKFGFQKISLKMGSYLPMCTYYKLTC